VIVAKQQRDARAQHRKSPLDVANPQRRINISCQNRILDNAVAAEIRDRNNPDHRFSEFLFR
jgi:hypothetical protein